VTVFLLELFSHSCLVSADGFKPWCPLVSWMLEHTYLNRRNGKAEVESFIIQVNSNFFRVTNKLLNLQCFIDNKLSIKQFVYKYS